MIVRRWIALGTVLLVLAMLPSAVGATHQPEDATINESLAFQNVVETGDLLFLIRYELDTATWRDTEYVQDATCSDSLDEDDACFTSINSGAAIHTVYDDTRATGSLIGVGDAPRIHHGLSGVYLAAGHGLGFSDTNYEQCIEGSSTLFTSVSGSCLAISWQSSSDLDDTQTEMVDDLLQILLNLEDAFPQKPTTYVKGDKITDRGATFAEEAFAQIRTVAPSAFEVATSQEFADISATPSKGQFESNVESDTGSSTFTSNFSALASGLFGLPANIAGGSLIMVLSMVAMAWTSRKTGSAMTGVLMGSVVVLGGLFQDLVPFGMVFAGLSLLIVIGLPWFFARMP